MVFAKSSIAARCSALLVVFICLVVVHANGTAIHEAWNYAPSSNPSWGIQVVAPPPPTASGGPSTTFIIVGESVGAGNLTAINSDNGSTLWTVTLESLQCSTGNIGAIRLYTFDGDAARRDPRVVLDCTVECTMCGVVGVNSNNGTRAWRISTSSTSELFNGVSGTNDLGASVLYTQYLTSSNNVMLVAIRVHDGTFVWKKALPRWPEQTFLSSDNILVLCPTQLPMFAVNGTDGKDLWNRTYSHSNIWMFGHTLLYVNSNGGLCAVEAATNRTIWNQTTTVSMYTSDAFATPDESQVVVRGAKNAAGINLLTGDVVFSFEINGTANFFAQVVVSGRYLVWVESVGEMTVVDAVSGQTLWTTSYPCNFELYTCHPGKNFAAVVGGAIFLSLPNSAGSWGNVTAFDAQTGEALQGPTPAVSTPGTPNVVALRNVAAFFLNGLTSFA
jgi:outer membrane protein assembly factor BamB